MEAPLTNRLRPEEIQDRLVSFKSEIYFPEFRPPENIQDLVNKSSNINLLRAMTPMDLHESCVLLLSYSMYLTSQENSLKSFINWCESNLKYIVGGHLQDVQAYSFAEKDVSIRANVPQAAELETRKQAAQVKLDHLIFLSKKLEMLAESMRNLAYEKHKYARGE